MRATRDVLESVFRERQAQDEKFPDQTLPDGTALRYRFLADYVKASNEKKVKAGTLTWKDVLEEEFYEALGEEDYYLMTEELIQVAAVAVRWVEDINRRES